MLKGPKPPNARFERRLSTAGHQWVAGLDEVGRGAWAGPVSVGVVVHCFDRRPPKGVRDSKQLTEPQREELYPRLDRWCTEWAVGHASAQECDTLGMTRALRLAARRGLDGLSVAPGVILLDGTFDYVTDPEAPGARSPEVHTVVRGDAACLSIAAASIMAKVTRDRLMRSWADSFPRSTSTGTRGIPRRPTARRCPASA